jgi:hypothetical protein
MKNKKPTKSPRATQRKPAVKVKDIAAKKSPKGGIIASGDGDGWL